jgi:hypothetical protein
VQIALSNVCSLGKSGSIRDAPLFPLVTKADIRGFCEQLNMSWQQALDPKPGETFACDAIDMVIVA